MHNVNPAAMNKPSGESLLNGQNVLSQQLVPHFTPASDVIRPRFCRQLMKKANGYVFSYYFNIRIYLQCARGERRKKPRVELLQAINSLLQGMCFYYNPLTNGVDRSVSQLANECGLTSTSASGAVSISRASRTLQALENEFGFIVCDLSVPRQNASRFYFTPAFFEALRVNPDHLRAARIKSERLQKRRGAL